MFPRGYLLNGESRISRLSQVTQIPCLAERARHQRFQAYPTCVAVDLKLAGGRREYGAAQVGVGGGKALAEVWAGRPGAALASARSSVMLSSCESLIWASTACPSTRSVLSSRMRFADVHRIDASLDRDELPLDPLVDLTALA